MPAFADVLTDEQRWYLVAYIRHLGSGKAEMESPPGPQALREEIKIEHWMKVAPRAIRILYEREKHRLWYVTFEGEVFRFPLDRPYEVEKVLGVEDHGISRLQGAALHGNTLYLTGNIRVNDNKGTTGWMMRVRWDRDDQPVVSKVFSTVEYGTTNTPFDHGWSATAISPDEKYIYVVSGSRTDHGEVQDNLGAYPGSRDEPLTARIFRIPIDAEDLLLPNDIEELKAMGYVYAEGLRNAFDIEFDGQGNLFAVVNSGDYDQNEDMFWVREGHHYGYPWVMGGMETPQQFPDWHPDPENDPFLNTAAVARLDDFYNDPGFAKRPQGVEFTKGMENYGPDANKFRDTATGKVMDASDLNIPITTFTPHSSPLGLVIDREQKLPGPYKGTAFTLRYTKGSKSGLMKPFTALGEDLLHLEMSYNPEKDNYDLRTTRVAEGFSQPVDAVLVDNDLFVLEYGGRQRGGNIWKVSIE
jgi:glucose/arabinose dehydrogenase